MPDERQPEQTQDDRERRIEALRNLAHESSLDDDTASGPQQTDTASPVVEPATPLPAPTARRSRTRRGMLVAAISILALIAIGGGIIAHIFQSSAPSAPPSPKTTASTFRPTDDNLFCPMDSAWSPSGKIIATLGYEYDCAQSFPSSYSYHPGIIELYNIETQVSLLINPDRQIDFALNLKPPTFATPALGAGVANRNTSQQVIDYGHLLWSPDGRQLGVTFEIHVTTGMTANGSGWTQDTIEGLLLCDSGCFRPSVLSHTLAKGEQPSGMWNIATGTYIPQTTPAPVQGASSNGWYADPALSPAVSYRWGSDGKLEAVTPLNATTPPTTAPTDPVGNPDGGASFTVWQPGYALLNTYEYLGDPTHRAIQKLPTPIETWSTSIAAWSPDGKYLFAAGAQGNNIYEWRIPLSDEPTPNQASLAAASLVGAPVLPMRDAGLTAALQRFYDASVNLSGPAFPVNLAWSPNGKWLAAEAVIPKDSGFYSAQDFAVRIYDTATGKVLRTLLPKATLSNNNAGHGQGTTFLRWSPDGSHLLFYDDSLADAQIWGPQELPE